MPAPVVVAGGRQSIPVQSGSSSSQERNKKLETIDKIKMRRNMVVKIMALNGFHVKLRLLSSYA